MTYWPIACRLWWLMYPRAGFLHLDDRMTTAAQDRWRAVNTRHLVALVRAAATFASGHLVERPAEQVAA